MKILLLEAFYATSHLVWVDGIIDHSKYEVDKFTMPGRHWKWRMEHSAIYFSEQIINSAKAYDIIMCTDFTNLAVLRGLLHANGECGAWYHDVPYILFMHENQITYPWSENDPDIIHQRDNHYGWINYLSAKASNHILYNSEFHKRDFIGALPEFLDQFPSEMPSYVINDIKTKSQAIHVGMHMTALSELENSKNNIAHIIWNHRWEYDKNPTDFFDVLFEINDEGIDFRLIIAGEKYKRYPDIFDIAKERLADKIVHFGYAKSRTDYLRLLSLADIIPVTSNQDFFGLSALEGIVTGSYPLLPDRLAFSEHIQLKNRDKYYYNSKEELKLKIVSLLIKGIPDVSEVKNHVMKYDWPQIIQRYDAVFEKMVKE